MLTLNDGSRVEARLVGDEHGHFWLSKDGRAFMGTSRKNIYKLIDDEQLEQLKADALERRTEANEQYMARMAQRRVGDVGSSYFGKKRGLIILVNFSDVSFERTHTNALFERIAISMHRAWDSLNWNSTSLVPSPCRTRSLTMVATTARATICELVRWPVRLVSWPIAM